MPPFARGYPDDTSLLRAVRAGDPDAVAAWYHREHPEVYRLTAGFLAQAEEAEDLAQDAMLHLLDKLPSWQDQTAYRAWRNKVVANLCRDRLRRLATRERHERRAVPELPSIPSPDSPDTEFGQAELRSLLNAALGQLTEREREVFVLRDLEACPAGETAQVLGICEGTVRSLLSLARRRLRRILGPQLAEHDG